MKKAAPIPSPARSSTRRKQPQQPVTIQKRGPLPFLGGAAPEDGICDTGEAPAGADARKRSRAEAALGGGGGAETARRAGSGGGGGGLRRGGRPGARRGA